MRLLLPATSAAFLVLASAAPASDVSTSVAQVCDRRATIVASLSEKYGEAVQAVGLDTGGNLLEIFASSEGTWTAILTSPRGQACIVAAGEAFEQMNLPPVI